VSLGEKPSGRIVLGTRRADYFKKRAECGKTFKNLYFLAIVGDIKSPQLYRLK
jgi:hypothetical protein